VETGFVRFALGLVAENEKSDELLELSEEQIPMIDTTDVMTVVEQHELVVTSSKASIEPQEVARPKRSWFCCCFGGDWS
jgi:hypothetical protein